MDDKKAEEMKREEEREEVDTEDQHDRKKIKKNKKVKKNKNKDGNESDSSSGSSSSSSSSSFSSSDSEDEGAKKVKKADKKFKKKCNVHSLPLEDLLKRLGTNADTGLPPEKVVTVIRDGKKQEVRRRDLMLGDIVELQAGDPVPADIRIISADKCKVSPSTKAKEGTQPAATASGPAGNLDLTPEMTSENALETRNLAFYTQTIAEGTCRGVVFATGKRTRYGKGMGKKFKRRKFKKRGRKEDKKEEKKKEETKAE